MHVKDAIGTEQNVRYRGELTLQTKPL